MTDGDKTPADQPVTAPAKPKRARRRAAVRCAEDFDAPAGDVTEVEQGFDERGLARAIDADQPEELPLPHLERDARKRPRAAVAFRHLDETQRRRIVERGARIEIGHPPKLAESR